MVTHIAHYKSLIAGALALVIVLPSVASAQVLYQPRTTQETIAYLYGVIAQLQVQLMALQNQSGPGTGSSVSSSRSRNPYFVEVTSLAATAIGRNEATLKGQADKGGSEFVDVWFEYGAGSSLREDTEVQVIKNTGRRDFTVILDDLRSNTTYSYRAVAEDEDGHRFYGLVRTFTTISAATTHSFSGRPLAETEGATDIRSTNARVQGFVSMNDYKTGVVFFVSGTNRSLVEDAEDYSSYEEIPVAAPSIKKQIANRSFTGRNTVTSNLGGLQNGTRHFYRVCVEYNEARDVRCGQVESFTTLN